MNRQADKTIVGDTTQWESFLSPRNRGVLLERYATQHVLRVYDEVLRQELALHFPRSSAAERDAVIDEWYALAICGDECAMQGEELRYCGLLNSMGAMVARSKRLPDGACWNDIITHEIGQFDDVIAQGLELGWSWRKIKQVYYGNTQIETAIKYGIDPDQSPEQLLAVLEEREVKRREAVMEDDLACGTTEGNGIEERFISRMQTRLGAIWGREPETITKDEIDNYIKDQLGGEPPSDL
jgi:hypothetical protein